ncbi:MAG: TIGR03560 family F420-dependent LLM class oxidoreductase [Chloroflexi bacterium]|nr:TIGR03560 family F420-dependent LLM class oxidoreductase [Chloroflexota bacterium]
MAQIFDGQIRFGIHAGPQHTTYAEYTNLWKQAEAMGYDWVSVFDHFVPINSDPEGPCFEGPTLLAAMAAQTSRIRCGILVVGNTYRHPAVLANIAATIDHVSAGRLELGIGAGWWEMEHQEYHIPYHTTGRRIRMLGEAAKMLRLLWTEHRANFDGRYYHLTDALNEPKPLQSPLPLWVGGMGEQLTLRVVAESADGWNTFLMPADRYQRKLDVLAEHCRAVGRDPRDIRKSLVVQALIGENESEMQERTERTARARGTSPELLRQQAVVGTPEQAAEQIMRYVQMGVGDFILGARPPYDYAGMQLFIEKVAPLVRKQAVQAAV